MKRRKKTPSALPILLPIAILLLVGLFAYAVSERETVLDATPNSEVVNSDIIPEPIDIPAATIASSSYGGYSFAIEIPPYFTARPEMNDTFNGRSFAHTDEAYFTSPDDAVEFFVFSPLWAGEPTYLDVSPKEILISQKTQENTHEQSKETTKWVTVRAKDNSYTRSYVSTRTSVAGIENTYHVVFGFKYKDQAAYEKYRGEYEEFKRSLAQFGD